MNKLPKIKELINMHSFRTRTAMYIGEKKISILKSFFDGIYYSLEAYNVNEEYIFNGFDDWIANYYGWTECTAGWKNIILSECNEDEEKAVDEFFNLYDKFKLKHNGKKRTNA